MDGRFTLKIELGNAAMSSEADIAEALAQIAGRVSAGETIGEIRDANGNTVGEYRHWAEYA